MHGALTFREYIHVMLQQMSNDEMEISYVSKLSNPNHLFSYFYSLKFFKYNVICNARNSNYIHIFYIRCQEMVNNETINGTKSFGFVESIKWAVWHMCSVAFDQ